MISAEEYLSNLNEKSVWVFTKQQVSSFDEIIRVVNFFENIPDRENTNIEQYFIEHHMEYGIETTDGKIQNLDKMVKERFPNCEVSVIDQMSVARGACLQGLLLYSHFISSSLGVLRVGKQSEQSRLAHAANRHSDDRRHYRGSPQHHKDRRGSHRSLQLLSAR